MKKSPPLVALLLPLALAEMSHWLESGLDPVADLDLCVGDRFMGGMPDRSAQSCDLVRGHCGGSRPGAVRHQV